VISATLLYFVNRQSNTPKITDSINKEAGNVICVLQHHCVTTMMSYCRVTPLVT